MNILYVSHRLPYPPNKGEKIRAFHQIEHLAKRHAIHLACLVNDSQDLQHVKSLEQYCASVDVVYRDKTLNEFAALAALASGKPLTVAYFFSRKLDRKIKRRLQSNNVDRIIVYSSAMAEYVRHVPGIPKVMDFVDVDSEKWRYLAQYSHDPLAWIFRTEASRLARYEAEIAQSFDHSIFVSEMECRLFRERVNGRPISVISNGVDLDYYVPRSNCASSPKRSTIVFTGSMDYLPNVDAVYYFCKAIFPIIRQNLPAVEFYIVGRNPTRRVRMLNRDPGVTVTGSVPDVRPYLAKAGVAVAPLRIARGIQNKVLEAMAMGVPVVGTAEAFGGIQAGVADGVRVANDPIRFAGEVLCLLEDRELHSRCSLGARQYVRRCHRWTDQGTTLESLLNKLQ